MNWTLKVALNEAAFFLIRRHNVFNDKSTFVEAGACELSTLDVVAELKESQSLDCAWGQISSGGEERMDRDIIWRQSCQLICENFRTFKCWFIVLFNLC